MNNFLFYLLESSICLALFYSIFWIFLKRETFFQLNRLFLISSVGFSLVIPLIRVSSPIASRQLMERTYVVSSTSAAQAPSLSIFNALLFVYILGVCLMLLRFGYKLLKVYALIRKNGVQRYNGLKVVPIEKNCSPFSFFNYVFINTADLSEDDFQRIIDHETIHIRQYHSIDLIILELLAIYQWFNPFVWPYRGSLKETHEYLADNAVIAQGCNTARYQLLIFEQHVGMKLFEFANNFNQSQIKRRITMITKNKSKRWARLKFLMMFPMICVLVLVFADSKVVGESYPDGQIGMDNIAPSPEETVNMLMTDDDKKSDKEKKAKLKEIDEAIKELKVKYGKTDDPEMKRKIKEKATQLQKEREKLLGNPKGERVKIEDLKKMYEKTDDPEKKKEIKMKMEQLEQKKKMEEVKKIDQYIKMLKKKYEETDDAEVKKEIKKKVAELEAKKKEIKK